MCKQNVFFWDVDGINVMDGKIDYYGLELVVNLLFGEWFVVWIVGSWVWYEYVFDCDVVCLIEVI